MIEKKTYLINPSLINIFELRCHFIKESYQVTPNLYRSNPWGFLYTSNPRAFDRSHVSGSESLGIGGVTEAKVENDLN